MNINNVICDIYKNQFDVRIINEYIKKQPELLINFFKDLNNKAVIESSPEISIYLFSLIENKHENVYKFCVHLGLKNNVNFIFHHPGFNRNIVNFYLNSFLEKDEDCVRDLLAHGFSADEVSNKLGVNLLQLAVKNCHDEEILKLIFASSSNLTEQSSLLFEAIASNNLAAVNVLSKYEQLTLSRNAQGNLPLHMAIQRDQLAMVKALLPLKSTPLDTKNAAGETPQALAPVLANDQDGKSLLHIALSVRNRAIVQELLQYPFDLNAPDEAGNYLLHYAVHFGNADIVADLLQAGASPHLKTPKGGSPLLLAIQKDHLAIADMLIPLGFGESEILEVLKFNRCDILKIMFVHGLRQNFLDGRGKSIAEYAVQGNLTQVLQLLDGHINWNGLIHQNRNLLSEAIFKRNEDSAIFLIDRVNTYISKDAVDLCVFDYILLAWAFNRGHNIGQSDEWLKNLWSYLIRNHTDQFSAYLSQLQIPPTTQTDIIQHHNQLDVALPLMDFIKQKMTIRIVKELEQPVDVNILPELDKVASQIVDVKNEKYCMETIQRQNPHKYEQLVLQRTAASSSLVSERQTQAMNPKLVAWTQVDNQVRQWAYTKQPLTLEKLILINRVLLPNDPRAGILRRPGQEVQAGPSPEHMYLFGEQVASRTVALLDWVEAECQKCEQGKANPIVIAGLAYQRLVSYHSFADSNGRTSRFLMDYILQRCGLPPAIMGDDALVAAFPLQPPNATPTEAVHKVYKGVLKACSIFLN